MLEIDEVVFSYTTKQAVSDGVLVLIPKCSAALCGIHVPAYFNDSVWNRYTALTYPDGNPNSAKRILEILEPFAEKARQCTTSSLLFEVVMQIDPNVPLFRNESIIADGTRSVSLKAIINAHDTDDSSPALFFMLPWED